MPNQGISLSIITYGEIQEGLLSSASPNQRSDQFDLFVATVDLLTIDASVARRYAGIRSNLRSQGLLIPDNDIWIAATALAHDLTVVTRDKHYARIPTLDIYRPN